jgi:flagellar motor switch/type III secretory pathway protein FliN
VQPFPWNQLPHVSRAEARAVSQFNARTGALNLERAFATLGALGAHTEVQLSRPQVSARTVGLDVAVALGFEDDGTLAQGLLFETESAFASTLVSELLRKPDERPKDLARLPSERVYGAFAASLVHLLRKGGSAPRVLAAGPSKALAADMQRSQPVLVTQALQIELRGRMYRASITGAPSELTHVNAGLDLATLGEMPLTLPIVVAQVSLDPEQVATLEVSDIVLVGQTATTVHLADPGSEWGLAFQKQNETQWSYVEQVALPWSTEHEPTGGEEPMKEALENVPVVARVELGSVSLSATEWSRMRPGDTLALGKKPGDLVTLRVAGVEVAKGELVVFEGQTGVRIVERIGAPAPRGDRTTV